MTKSLLFPALSRQLLALLCAGLLGAASAWAQTNGSPSFNLLLEQVKSQLQNNQIAEALQSAQQAVRQAEGDYRSYYYLGLALMAQQRYAEAQREAERSKALAPESVRPSVQNLIDEIVKRSQGGAIQEQARQALTEGLNAKAARLYEQSWQASPQSPELGLKAAELYRDRLNQPIDAGRVLWQVANAYPNAGAGTLARDQLSRLQGALDRQAMQWLADAENQPPSEAIALVDKAQAISPALGDLPWARARASAKGDDLALFQGSIKQLAQRRQVSADTLSRLPRMEKWLKQAEFVQFLEDLLGTQLKSDTIQKFNERNAQYAEALRRYESEMASLEARKSQRAAKVAECNRSRLNCADNCSKKHGGFFGSAVKEDSCIRGCWKHPGGSTLPDCEEAYPYIPLPVKPTPAEK